MLKVSLAYTRLAKFYAASASKSQKITFILTKCTKIVAIRAAPFGQDMHQIIYQLGLRPRPPSWFRGGTPGEGGKGWERKGGVGGIGTPPPGTGREGKGMEGTMGWESREGEGKEGEGGRGNKHTQFETCGAAHVYRRFAG